jgi:hypothetical protein
VGLKWTVEWGGTGREVRHGERDRCSSVSSIAFLFDYSSSGTLSDSI